MAELGYFALRLAFFITLYAIIIDILGVKFRDSSLIRSGRNAMLGCWLCLMVSIIVLLIALLQGDFRIAYVANYTSRALPKAYRLSALWAGAAGSLLLWTWMQITFAALAFGRISGKIAYFLSTCRIFINIVMVFFLAVLLLDKNPFTLSTLPPADGAGLNPLLQHPAMVLHPPTLFLGYSAYLIPFAWALAILCLSYKSSLPPFFVAVRNWMLFAWVLLTIGNILGAWWAYEELGWGGFWGWDPVENSSLMPWLIGVGLLHSFKKFKAHSSIAAWVLLLSIITYSMGVFGTFLTRYGLVSSVHAFPEPGWGILFLVLLIVIWLLVAVFFIRRLWQPAGLALAAPPAGSGVLVLANWIFMALTIVILLGTLFPFLSSLFSSQQITLQPEYFTRITSPGGLAILLLMGICPVFFQRGFSWRWHSVAALAVIVAVAISLLSFRVLAIPCLIICGFVIICLIAELKYLLPSRQGAKQAIRPRQSLSWYGSRIAHLGVVFVFIAIAGAEGYGEQKDVAIRPGESVHVGKYRLEFQGLSTFQGPNYKLTSANIDIYKGEKHIARRQPGLARYDNGQMANEVDIRRSLAGDIYVALTAIEGNGPLINLRVLIKPLIDWLWIGGIVMVLGGVMVLVQWLLAAVTKPATAEYLVQPVAPDEE